MRTWVARSVGRSSSVCRWRTLLGRFGDNSSRRCFVGRTIGRDFLFILCSRTRTRALCMKCACLFARDDRKIARGDMLVANVRHKNEFQNQCQTVTDAATSYTHSGHCVWFKAKNFCLQLVSTVISEIYTSSYFFLSTSSSRFSFSRIVISINWLAFNDVWSGGNNCSAKICTVAFVVSHARTRDCRRIAVLASASHKNTIANRTKQHAHTPTENCVTRNMLFLSFPDVSLLAVSVSDCVFECLAKVKQIFAPWDNKHK